MITVLLLFSAENMISVSVEIQVQSIFRRTALDFLSVIVVREM